MTCNIDFTVFLVDDDDGVLRAVTRVLEGRGYQVRPFSSARLFLAEHDPGVKGCAIFDISMPELDGLELQAALAASGVTRPVIFITGVGDVPISVKAMKAGAVDFLTKPVSSRELLAAVELAVEMDARSREQQSEITRIEDRIFRLTRREREVLTHVISGELNKQIAAHLGIAEKTIKIHRGRMMRKMGVRTVAELVRSSERAGVRPARANDQGPPGRESR